MMETIRCPNCQHYRSVHALRWPYTCRCGVTFSRAEALPGDAPGDHPLKIVKHILLGQCFHCDKFPCLDRSECRHERAVRERVDCPDGRWFYV